MIMRSFPGKRIIIPIIIKSITGTNLQYGQEAWGDDNTKKHIVKITKLKPGEKYFFEVMSQNKNYAYDAYYSF